MLVSTVGGESDLETGDCEFGENFLKPLDVNLVFHDTHFCQII